MLAVAAVVAGVFLGRRSADTDGREQLVRPRGNASLTEARGFTGFPVYFAGESVAGHRLEAVARVDATSPAVRTEFSFVYGSCPAVGGRGCPPPLTILLWPACYRYETRYSIPARERMVVRGVPARKSREFRRLELYPAKTTIVINGDGLESDAQLLEVARRLRGVNVALRAGAPLPARPPHAGRTVRCTA